MFVLLEHAPSAAIITTIMASRFTVSAFLIACLPAMGSLIKKRRKRMRKKKHKKLLKKTRWERRQK